MKDNPKVSIILPCYNSKAEWLRLSIDSVLSQNFHDFELIIIDDASEENIKDIIKWYNDNRIRYYRNQINLKITKSLNVWISLARWLYIARIDDDDIREDKHKLEKQLKFLERNPQYGLIWTDIHSIDWSGNIINKRKIYYSDSDIRNHILWWCPFVHSSVLFRKECIETVWTYDTWYTLAEDYELWMRIWMKYKFCNLKNSYVLYRINESWICNKKHSKQILIAYKAAFKYLKCYPNSYYYFFKRIIKFPCLYFVDFVKWIKIKFKIDWKFCK